MNSMYKGREGHTCTTSSCCAEFANYSQNPRYGATPRTKQKENRKPGSQEARRGRPRNQKKRKHPGRRRQDTTVQQSYLILVPTFVLWYKQNSYVNSSILLRTRHVLLDHCSSTITIFFSCFLSFYTIHCVFSFKSSPFSPIFSYVDPFIVVLTLSFYWFLILFFVKVLFEEIVDVVFPSFSWSTDRSVGPIS